VTEFSLYFASVRKWIAYIFIMIFSLQVVPVKEIGKILFKGQITEEEVHGYALEENDDSPKLKKDGEPFDYSELSQNEARSASLSHEISTAMHSVAHLPDYHVPDILTPPPNC
jgi:hypothetical protein